MSHTLLSISILILPKKFLYYIIKLYADLMFYDLKKKHKSLNGKETHNLFVKIKMIFSGVYGASHFRREGLAQLHEAGLVAHAQQRSFNRHAVGSRAAYRANDVGRHRSVCKRGSLCGFGCKRGVLAQVLASVD